MSAPLNKRLEDLLRRDAENFALVVAVVAEELGRDPAELAREALRDALARLTETGALGSAEEDE